jgi:phytoene dehydrogenase-like protein
MSTGGTAVEPSSASRTVLGGPAALVEALERCARSAGVEFRPGQPVRAIRVQAGRVHGVELEDGEILDAPAVAASTNPVQTFLTLVPPVEVPPEIDKSMRAWRCRGTTAVIRLALDGPLEFAGRPDEQIDAARIAEGLDEMERAFDAIKYRGFSKRPILDVRVPTIHRTDLAPPGHHVVSIMASYVPYDLDGGWTARQQETLGDRVVARLAVHAPTVRNRILAREVLSPVDLEARYALPGGHLHHGEHALDQFLSMRPSARLAHYRTPIRGLFLCGSASHPGGGLTGAPGAIAARVILHDLRKSPSRSGPLG